MTKFNYEKDFNNFPVNNIFLITPPRSGSTWVFDSLRTNPSIELDSKCNISNWFAENKRRYPRDLSNMDNCSYKVEVMRGKYARIPLLDTTDLFKGNNPFKSLNSFNIEKFHPEEFEFKTDEFIKKIHHLNHFGINIILYIVVRNPYSSIASFINYQERNKSWYPHITGKEIIDYFVKTFKSLIQLKESLPANVIIFEKYQENPTSFIYNIYKTLWSDFSLIDEGIAEKYIAESLTLIVREKRVTLKSSFFGKKINTPQMAQRKLSHFFEDNKSGFYNLQKQHLTLLKL